MNILRGVRRVLIRAFHPALVSAAAAPAALMLVFALAAVTLPALAPCPAEAGAPSMKPDMPREILSWREEILSKEEYQALADEWRAYIHEHRKSAAAYIQLSRALRYAGTAGTEERQKLIRQALDLDPNCPEALDAIACTALGSDHPMASRDEARRYAERAIEAAPSWPYPYFTLWSICVTDGRSEEADEQLRALVRKGGFPSPLIDFGFNLLASADPGGIIFTNGDNDTYPLLALQTTYGTRTDVTVVNLSLLNVLEYTRRVWKPGSGGQAPFTVEEINALYKSWEESKKETPGAMFLRAFLDRVRDGRWKDPVYFAVTVAPPTLQACGQALEMEGLLWRVKREKKEATGEDEHRINLEKTRRLFQNDFRLESATDFAFSWTPDSAIRSLMLNYPAMLRLVATESAQKGDLTAARSALREAIRILDFHGEKETLREVAKYWKGLDPDNPEVKAWQ